MPAEVCETSEALNNCGKDERMNSQIRDIVNQLPGTVGYYYENLVSGETDELNARQPYLAASVIKLFVLEAVMQAIHEGRLDPQQKLRLEEEDKMPSCGALLYLHAGIDLTVRDLYTLMITLSDNTATNQLIRLVGIESINEVIAASGYCHTALKRLLFDGNAQNQGKENSFSPADVGLLLKSIHQDTFVSRAISREASAILLKQQLKNKIPALIPRQIPIAHKTGEDAFITHDVGIVYGDHPFILCLAANETDVIRAEEAFRKIAGICFRLHQRS